MRQEAELQARLAAAARLHAQQAEHVRVAPAAPSQWAAPVQAGPASVSEMWSEFGAGAVPEQLQALWSADGLGASFGIAEPQRPANRLPLYSRVSSVSVRVAGGTAGVAFCESENGNGVAHWPLGPQLRDVLRDVTLH